LLHFEVANAYDASYLWLARRTGAELVTPDSDWKRLGRKVRPFGGAEHLTMIDLGDAGEQRDKSATGSRR
jgi:hypothetical protein